LVYLYSTIKMMHGPINISELLSQKKCALRQFESVCEDYWSLFYKTFKT